MRHHPTRDATPAVAVPDLQGERARIAEAIASALGGDAQPAPDEQPQAVPAPSRSTLRLLVADNRAVLAPWWWMAAVDVTAFASHYVAPAVGWSSLLTAGVASAAVTAGSLWRSRESRLQARIKTLKTRRKVQRTVRTALVAGTVWELTAATWTPIGPHAGMQLTLLGGGLVIAAPHLWRNRRRPDLTEPLTEIAAPVEDERITRFREHFCGSGTLKDARLHDFETVAGGFRFHVLLSLAHHGTFRDVKALEDQIAKFYDVPGDHVSVEPPESRSARRAVVTVLTAVKAHEREEPWDGRSTYDPNTGCFELGRFADSTTSHWQLHVPGNGACGGTSVGKIGSGKTGTMHVVACEAGQAKLCAACAAARDCPQCELRRICAVWMGDPQRQPFGVWRGRADLTAWGPLACVRMLSWMHAAMRCRADYFGRMEWTDHLGRANTGKGWFDPTPQFPIIMGVFDEWPIIAADPVLAPFAVPLARDIGAEGRKVGVAAILGTQEADVDVYGGRPIREAVTAFNTACHRCERIAKQMLNLDGNPAELPEGVHGVSYLKGYDKRSGIVQRTKHLPEYLRRGQGGVDVREIADRIAADPITYDEAVLRAIQPLGYTGPGQILSDDDGWDLNTLLGVVEGESEAEPTPSRTPSPSAVPGPVPAHDVRDVREALSVRTDADTFDLMETTGMSALQVSKALVALIAEGVAAQASPGRYVLCTNERTSR